LPTRRSSDLGIVKFQTLVLNVDRDVVRAHKIDNARLEPLDQGLDIGLAPQGGRNLEPGIEILQFAVGKKEVVDGHTTTDVKAFAFGLLDQLYRFGRGDRGDMEFPPRILQDEQVPGNLYFLGQGRNPLKAKRGRYLPFMGHPIALDVSILWEGKQQAVKIP